MNLTGNDCRGGVVDGVDGVDAVCPSEIPARWQLRRLEGLGASLPVFAGLCPKLERMRGLWNLELARIHVIEFIHGLDRMSLKAVKDRSSPRALCALGGDGYFLFDGGGSEACSGTGDGSGRSEFFSGATCFTSSDPAGL